MKLREDLSTFLRPNLGKTPAPLRRFLEPLVAALALSLLATLLVAGSVTLVVFMGIVGLIYAILTHVFGLELGLAT